MTSEKSHGTRRVYTPWSEHHDPSSSRNKAWLQFLRFLGLIAMGAPLYLLGADILKWGGQRDYTGNKLDVGWGNAFDFLEIEAKETLDFQPCINIFECAKLKLPLDYFNNTFPNETVNISIVKLAARVPVDDPRYGGPILINPGGPGGSGIAAALAYAQHLQTVTGSATFPKGDGKEYDIIGFDPRGIGFTEPPARCMPDAPTSWSWSLRVGTEGMLGSSDAALGRLWSMAHAWGSSCQQFSESQEGPDIKKYMSTASVARDMLEIAEKHADLVAGEAKANGQRVANEVADSKTVKLQYWGFSYGTYLGSTFASMFPDRVGRLVLDGVVNIHDYHDALGQGSLLDSEKGLKSFYTFCQHADAQVCPLTSPSALDIELRVKKIIASLYHNPITIASPTGPDIFTYTDLMAMIFASLYLPALVFPYLATIFADVETRGGPILDSLIRAAAPNHIYSCPISSPNSTTRPLPLYDTDVPQDAIMCGDGFNQTSLTITEFEEYWHLLSGISPTAGSFWATLKLKCASWPVVPLHRLGPSPTAFGAKTSFPILWVANTADPVTPLRSARLMRQMFPGSGLLVQDSAGHCSDAMPNLCSISRIRNYFQTGALPEEDIVCVPAPSPFSLNSTVPGSPFYDPSLGQPVYEEEEEGGRVLVAAKRAQRLSLGFERLGMGAIGARVRGIVKGMVEEAGLWGVGVEEDWVFV